jgi:membrane-bound serine protease (ClpP class)
MIKNRILLLAVFLCGACCWASAAILVIQLEGPIEPVRAEFVTESMKTAEEKGHSLILLEIDTPGGDVESMKAIVAKILNSTVPVAVYVTPSGAHAASAGFIILMASDVAVMSEGTNTGAAHPVLAFGGMMPVPEDEKTKPLFEKIQKDILAYLRGIVAHRGRNQEAAVSAVTDSTSYTAEEAMEQNLIDIIANSREELIEKLEGRSVTLFSGNELTLAVRGQAVEIAEMTFRQSVLSFISNPSLALILGLVGILGLFFEFQHPGFIFPGVIGGICLVLALLGFSMLPINYVGVILIILAIGFFVAEIKVQGFGILGVGGIISLALGFLILVDAPDPSLAIPLELILGVVIPVGVIMLLLTRLVIKAMKRPSLTGSEGMQLDRGTVATELAPRGKVYVHGEYWEAESATGEPISPGTEIVVERSEGMRLFVRPADKQNETESIR